MKSAVTTLTERGQISVPAFLRKQLRLKAGQLLQWERITDDECRIRVVRKRSGDAASMLGAMKKFQRGDMPKTTAGWMKILREGER